MTRTARSPHLKARRWQPPCPAGLAPGAPARPPTCWSRPESAPPNGTGPAARPATAVASPAARAGESRRVVANCRTRCAPATRLRSQTVALSSVASIEPLHRAKPPPCGQATDARNVIGPDPSGGRDAARRADRWRLGLARARALKRTRLVAPLVVSAPAPAAGEPGDVGTCGAEEEEEGGEEEEEDREEEEGRAEEEGATSCREEEDQEEGEEEGRPSSQAGSSPAEDEEAQVVALEHQHRSVHDPARAGGDRLQPLARDAGDRPIRRRAVEGVDVHRRRPRQR